MLSQNAVYILRKRAVVQLGELLYRLDNIAVESYTDFVFKRSLTIHIITSKKL